jgi:U3 small nucleolar RNA-associated protein 21
VLLCWQTLANLDDIKKRNRPAEAPKAPAEAPFFLPTLPGLEPAFVSEGNASHKSEVREVRRMLVSLESPGGAVS